MQSLTTLTKILYIDEYIIAYLCQRGFTYICKLKFKTRMAEYPVLQAANAVFYYYYETLLRADLRVADLQSHFNMIRIYIL